jgi:hypothetical protein
VAREVHLHGPCDLFYSLVCNRDSSRVHDLGEVKMCWFHKWSRWEQFRAIMLNISSGTKYVRTKQTRHCLKCNKQQEEFVTQD